MEKLKVLELFSGIGACSKALERLGIDYEIVDSVEIDKYAVKSFNAIHNTNFEPQDICKWDKDIEVDLITHGSPCITEDSLILTKDGYKEYKDLQIGEYVLTKSNTWQKIVKKFNTGVHKTYYLQGMGFENIHCTLNHKFYVREKYRKGHKSIRCFKKPIFKELKNISKNDYFGVPVIQEEEFFYRNDLDFWYMIGYYLGDGWLASKTNDVILACSEVKLKKLKSRLDINKWKYTYHWNSSCYRFRFANKEIYDFIKKYIGTGSFEKRICGEMLRLPKKQLKALLDGYLDSDGCKIKKNIQFSSVNRQLIYSISSIINKVYHRPTSISKNIVSPTKMIDGRMVNQHDWYLLRFKPMNDKQDKAFYEDGYIWYPFNKLLDGQEECVYNMEIENDHSYIIQGCVSKNCQDFSLAGKQAGGDKDSGTRSSLMYETIRIVEKLKPKYVIWENVKNLLSKKHRHNFDAYLETMESLGYTNYYQVLNAKDYGIPQNRERVFTISILDDGSFIFPPKQELKLKLKDILEDNVDEKYYLSDEQVNKIKFSKVTQDLKDSKCVEVNRKYGIFDTEKSTHQAGSVYDENGLAPTLDTMQGGWRQPCIEEKGFVQNKYKNFIEEKGYIPEMFNPYNEKEIKDVAPTQSTYCGSMTSSATVLIKNNTKQGYLEATDDDGCYIRNIDNKRGTVQKEMIPTLKTSPDIGVCVNMDLKTKNKRIKTLVENTDFTDKNASFMDIYNQKVIENTCGTLKSGMDHQQGNIIYDTLRIRKLTPKECWRLMGFDDEDFEKAEKVNSNTQLYKQAGNSIVVNVLEAIFKNLLKDYLWSDLD